jgi:hypothetical protein
MSTSDGTLPGVTRDALAERSGRHWKRWEIGQLLSAAEDGASLSEVAESQKRSLEGVRRKLARLIAGEDECPDECRPSLDLVKRQAAQHAAKPSRSSTQEDLAGQALEQYRAICQGIERLELILGDIRSVAEASLSVCIAAGDFPASALSTHVTPRLGRHLVSWASDIRKAAAAKPPTDAEIEADLKDHAESVPAEFDTH